MLNIGRVTKPMGKINGDTSELSIADTMLSGFFIAKIADFTFEMRYFALKIEFY